jgi:hypothetical protein
MRYRRKFEDNIKMDLIGGLDSYISALFPSDIHVILGQLVPAKRWCRNTRRRHKPEKFDLDSSGSGYGLVADTCEHSNKTSGSITCGEFLDHLRGYLLLTKLLLYVISKMKTYILLTSSKLHHC